ncbi:Pyridoxine/pyridoxamine 5'-phosphate oxidase [Seminavis robusta]|uniref:pyridoxal 5'-phosphate synthase n=1 Tax=Seminavis robusta TaxID=568900 RepID=A0A9N8DXB5_9STRA|nr:Pyridoxine/pyridoxamine 5'-phosphate oxidase [Seminavis robusta]|eukprot:Sro364_g127070.1 Pyridoxine/pyridoxamine 5'-phosphate oxidase (231) ;mRNA; f:24088-24780
MEGLESGLGELLADSNPTNNEASNMGHDPLSQFLSDWAKAKEAKDSNAFFCTLATVTEDGAPELRMLALRGVDAARGTFLIETHDSSPKFHQLKANGKWSLLTFWNQPIMMQYRIKGTGITLLDATEMEERFQKKPKSAQLLPLYYANHQAQSSVLKGGREEFVSTMKDLLNKEYAEKPVPFQPSLVGIQFKPDVIEEWRGSAADRLHERYRYVYQKSEAGLWNKETLVP